MESNPQPRRSFISLCIASVFATASGCLGLGDDKEKSSSPSSVSHSTTHSPTRSTGATVTSHVEGPEYSLRLTVANEMDRKLSATLTTIEQTGDSGDDTPVFGRVVFDRSLDPRSEAYDFSQYRTSGHVMLVLEVQGRQIYREQVEPYEELDVVVHSTENIDTSRAYV